MLKKGLIFVLLMLLVLVGCTNVTITFKGLENVPTAFEIGATLPDFSEIVTAEASNESKVQVTFDTSKIKMDEAGEYDLVIKATTSGASKTEIIKIKVIDNRKPVISGTKDWTLSLGGPLPNFLQGVSVNDPIEGNITNKLEINGIEDIDTNKPGIYEITYYVITTRGAEATMTVKVIVLDSEVYSGRVLRIETNNKKFLVEGIGYLSYDLYTDYYRILNGEVTKVSLDELYLGQDHVYYFMDPEKPNHVRYAVIDGGYSYQNIRVRINYRTSISGENDIYHSEVRLVSSAGVTLKNITYSKTYDVPANQEMIVKVDYEGKVEVKVSNQVVMTDPTLIIFTPKNNGLIQITSISRGSQRLYPGRLEISPHSLTNLLVVNDVNVEEYLKYVVPSEMPVSFGAEALKAQAVAARTYAVKDMRSRTYISEGYHIDDSVMSQVYNNSSAQTASNNAILATKGIVATYDGQFIQANYYSTGSGATASAHEVWFSGSTPGTPIPYLTSKVYAKDYHGNILQFDINNESSMLAYFKLIDFDSPDRISDYHRWKTSLNLSTLKSALQTTLTERYNANSSQVLTKSGNNFISSPIPSNIGDIVDIRPKVRGGGGLVICLEIVTSTNTFNVYGEYNIRMLFKNITLYYSSPTQNTYVGPKSFSFLPSGFFATEVSGNTITFYGGGWGHGVGMSQYGARALATYMTYDQILKFYYIGIDLVNIEQYQASTRIDNIDQIKELIQNYIN